MMWFYRFCDLTLQSNVELLEIEAPSGPAHLVFHLEPNGHRIRTVRRWNRHWYRHDGEVFLSYARNESNSIIRFPKVADFVVSADSKSISCFKRVDIPIETIKHLLLDQVLPRVLCQQGKTMLHASCVLLPRGSVAFVGGSKSGKSTLAAAFYGQGFPLLSDDCLLLDERWESIVAIPSYLTLRLWPDSFESVLGCTIPAVPVVKGRSKKRLTLPPDSRSQSQEAPLLGIFCLDSSLDSNGNVLIHPISKRDSLIAFTKHSFQLGITDLDSIQQLLSRVERVVERVPFYSLDYQREYDKLPVVCKAILEKYV